jgi:hypothetical protein
VKESWTEVFHGMTVLFFCFYFFASIARHQTLNDYASCLETVQTQNRLQDKEINLHTGKLQPEKSKHHNKQKNKE